MSHSYRALAFVVRCLLGTFFRRIEISGLENVPAQSGGLIVAWHPNALVDPALIFISCPRRVVFGARHGIFGWPVIGRIVKAIGTVPLYRSEDLADGASDEARRAANDKSLQAMANAVAAGAYTVLFPEGLSHDDSSPREFKTGAARIYYQSIAATAPDAPMPVLLPVGLHYDEKRLFGSSVLIVYHPPLELDASLRKPPAAGASEEARRAHYRTLTDEFEHSLKKIVYPTENWKIHQLLHRARKLVRAERAARAGATLPPPTMTEQVLAFRRLWTGYNELVQTEPERVTQLLRRIKRYDRKLTALAIDDHELDANATANSVRIHLKLAAQTLLVFAVLPPLLLFGLVINLPPAALVWLISKRRSKLKKDEATIKILTGSVAFPLAWLIVAVFVGWNAAGYGLVPGATSMTAVGTGAVTFVLGALSAFFTLHYLRLAVQTLRNIRLHGTHTDHRDVLRSLRAERSELCDAVVEISAGLDLPGTVQDDGRILDGPDG